MTISHKTIVALLQKGIPPPQWQLYSNLLQETASGFSQSTSDLTEGDELVGKQLHINLVKNLVDQVYLQLDAIQRIRILTADFNKRILKAATKEEVETLTILLITELGATGAKIREDKKAFKRWFGRDTIQERCTTRIGACEYKIAFYLNCLGPVASEALTITSSEGEMQKVWKQLHLEKILETILGYVGDERLRETVFRCLADTLRILPPSVRAKAVKDSTIVFVYRSSLEIHQQVWIQVQALRLLAVLSDQSLEKALHIRLDNPRDGDDIFVRKQAVLLIGEYLETYGQLINLLPKLVADPSPYVRQAIAVALYNALASDQYCDRHPDFMDILSSLLFLEERQEVRAASLLILPKLIIRKNLSIPLTELLCRLLKVEKHSFVLRVGLKVFRDTMSLLGQNNSRQAAWFYAQVYGVLEYLHVQAEDLSVRRWAAQAINYAEVQVDLQMAALWRKLEAEITPLRLGKSKAFPKKWFAQLNEELLGRILALLAEKSGGLTIDQGFFRYRITKGDRFDFRFWRFLHEWLHPSPDKRQAFNHTIGRVYRGNIHAPTSIMAELTQTKVPGEPLLHATEAGWRPYLPLVDQLLASLRGFFRGPTITIFTAEGRTKIVPPGNLFKRFWARLLLTCRYSHYAALRNWREKSGEEPSRYVGQVEKLGFRILFSGYSSEVNQQIRQTDPAVSRFFPVFPVLFDASLPGKFQEYIFSIYENSLYELGLFTGLLLLLFFGLRLSASIAVIKARNRLPLVVGGWGTRGKSGVERLKAAVFESLGHGILSKSTGCEAMFLHSHQYGRTHEMFLFRPYDKATIWEHHSLIKMADQMKCSIFLWECMGLTPAYVDILQHKWSRDDYSTITNTYPDHEDIQGPAGYNIPEVMTCFIPDKGSLFTTEEQMYPILAENALSKKTDFQRVGWLEAGLLTPDILQRFPYEEHPYNIALVAALAERLGVSQDLALKEMADRVIPDLGVLKSFPKAQLLGRTLEFVNGMSANERFATLSNWQRMGFDTESVKPTPGIFLHVVVNNRADRISRSRMFGSILAKDIIADRYVMIGSNLAGLYEYTMEAWHEYLGEIMSRFASVSDPVEFVEFFKKITDNLRVPHEEEFICQRLGLMLGTPVSNEELSTLTQQVTDPQAIENFLKNKKLPNIEALANHIHEHLTYFREYTEFLTRLTTRAKGGAELLKELEQLVTTWFKRRIIIVEDFHASGDMVIDKLCAEIPPGLHCRIMGVQNIKGTGLDFVYRWQAWERCWTSCNKLRAEDEAVFAEGLNEMMAFQDYGILCDEYVRETLALALQQPFTQNEACQAGLHLIETNLKNNLKLLNMKMSSTRQSSGFVVHLLNALEAFLDSGDAIRRRKIANTIYQDLAAERISHQRAALELQELNKRQKGGWLVKKLKR